MSWKDIIKARKAIPNKKIRDEIDRFLNSVDKKVTVREVNQHLIKKLGVVGMAARPASIKTYLFGWHTEKAEDFDPNVDRKDDYFYEIKE